MFQILIADDEPNIREGVRQFITRRCPEWQVVGAARDGKEALAMAERFLPDCIMTDITMPHVNGLEFLEKIKEELPDAKLLILSGYDDFEYAVQGMRLGVSDYLLKPLDTELLIQRLDAFAAELTQRQQQWQDRVQQMQQRLHQEQKIRELMWRASAGELASEEMKELQQFCIGSDRYLVALFQGGPEIRQELPALLNQRFEKKLDAYVLNHSVEGMSFIVFSIHQEVTNAAAALLLTRELTAVVVAIRRKWNQMVHFFLGGIKDNIYKLEKSGHEAKEAAEYSFYEMAPPVRTISDVLLTRVTACPEIDPHLTEQVALTVAGGDAEAIAGAVDGVLSWFYPHGVVDAAYIKMAVLDMCLSVLKKRRGQNPITYVEYKACHQEIMEAGTLEELQECFKNLLLLCRAAEEKKNPGQELVSRIDEIMGEHLSDLQFSLDDVAAELYISPNYLRQLFKQASGQTFTEHLTEMRMKEAQRLLDDESLKIYEVAERTGYADSRYFSVCYKKYWHITPTDYRRTLQESG